MKSTLFISFPLLARHCVKITILLIFTYASGQDSSSVFSRPLNDSLKGSFSVPDTGVIKNLNPVGKKEISIQLPSAPSTWIRSTGQLTWENHYATLQNPMSRTGLAYSRLGFQGTLFIAGLPFRSTAFYTTENSSVYRSNFINVRFDAEQYKRMLKQDAEKNMGRVGKSMSYYQLLLSQAQNYLGLLDTQIKAMDHLIPKEKPQFPDTSGIKNRYRSQGDSLVDKYRHQEMPDSFSNGGRDSVNMRLANIKARQDSLQSLRDSVFMKIQQWQQRYQQDSAKYAEYKALLEGGPENLLRDSVNSVQQSRLKKLAWISRIKNFQAGQAIANYNELSLWGLSLIGMDAAIEHSGWGIGMTLGRALNADGFFNPGTRPEYTKNLGGLQLSKTDSAGNKITAAYFYSYDIEKVPQKERNSVFSLEVKKTYRRYSLSLLGASSQFETQNPVWLGEGSETSVDNLANKALRSQLDIQLEYNAKLTGKWNYIGSAYTTIGNPFLRKNYSEAEIGWEQGWLKNKLKSKVYYKDLVTLTSELTPDRNRIKGAGISVQSNFSKGLNFFASYSPYEQGNNHPDTAFRTFNRTSLLTGGLSYMKTWKTVMWFVQGVYTHSAISGDQLPLTNTELVSLENTLSWNGIHDLRIDVSYNQASPNLDSLNFLSAGGLYQRQVNQKFKLGGGFRAIGYSSNSSLFGIGLNSEWLLWRKMAVASCLQFDRVNNWWGIEGVKAAFTSNITIRYSW